MLEVINLHVSVDGKEILKGVNLKVDSGKVHALMGPNGSGKSTLANVLMGHPKYEVTKGDMLLDGQSILGLDASERAKRGLFLSFQYPQEISGVTISNFLKSSLASVKDRKVSYTEFKKLIAQKAVLLDMKPEFLERYLNVGFSGGEKKRAEILQMLVLEPRLAILDETDSGLDIDALKVVAQGVRAFSGPSNSILIITHYKRILDYVKPDKLSILIDGKIALEGTGDLADHLEEKGYGWIQEN